MEDQTFELEPLCLFSESAVWQLNRDYYEKEGIRAWQNGTVPHHMTSNSMVGKTYAELILGLLRDLAQKGRTSETVYIMELGAGHGRLAYHVLKHLEQLVARLSIVLLPYCYIISDIAEESLSFFLEHPQLQPFFKQGKADVCYFDATASDQIDLLYDKRTIAEEGLSQPLVLVANYFFDSLPIDLFYVKDKKLSSCLAALYSDTDPAGLTEAELIEHMEIKFFKERVEAPFYEEPIYNEILESYRNTIEDSYIFFPVTGFKCLRNLENLSKEGVMLLSMDKGF
ncbi:MAG: SAM-dependent methyltransferase [Saprospiraceae bacterium]